MPDLPDPRNRPPQIDFNKKPVAIGEEYPPLEDPAARIDYSRHKFPLPKITAGDLTFVWPVGIEAFSRTGAATLGIHKYLGRHYVDVHIVHLDEARIEMEGTFPGLTSTKNMRDLIEVLVAPGAKELYLPGVFTAIQSVFSVDYDFRHPADDFTHSINYRIAFVRTTTGKKVSTKNTALFDALDETPGPPKNVVIGAPDRSVTTTDGMATLRAVSDYVYQDPDKWEALVGLNKDYFSTYNTSIGMDEQVNPFKLATMRLPLGTVVRY
jgi:hypothetical protein